MLLAESYRKMQAQYRIIEEGLRRSDLCINQEKTEYMVIGDNKQHKFFNTAGNLIRSTDLINYLGYQRSTEDGLNHLQQRLRKARTASLTIQAILHKTPHLPLHTQLTIVNACTRSTLLYGTEACGEEELETLKSEMNKVLRRLGRQILHTSNAAANQTIQLDSAGPR